MNPHLERLQRRYLTLRLIGWLAAALTSIAVALTGSDTAVLVAAWALLALVPEVIIGAGVPSKLAVSFGFDAVIATALWWSAGPVAAVDVVALLAAGGAGLLLAAAAAQVIAVVAVASGALRMVLAVAVDPPWFDELSATARAQADAAAVDSLVLIAVLAVVAVLSIRAGSTFQEGLAGSAAAASARTAMWDAVPIGIWVLDAGNPTKVVTANEAAVVMVGSGSKDLFQDGFPELIRTPSLDAALRTIFSEDTGSGLVELATVAGRPFQAQMDWAPSDAGTVVSVVDITAELEQAQADTSRERQYFAGVDHAPVPLLLVDIHGYIVHGNQSAASFLEMEAAGLVGMPVERLVHTAVRSELANAIARLAGGDETHYSAELRTVAEAPLYLTAAAGGDPPEVLVFRLGS